DVGSRATGPALGEGLELVERTLAAVAPAHRDRAGLEGDAAHRRVDRMAGRAAQRPAREQLGVGRSNRSLLAMAGIAGVGGIVLGRRRPRTPVAVTALA